LARGFSRNAMRRTRHFCKCGMSEPQRRTATAERLARSRVIGCLSPHLAPDVGVM
jgi:hypothetical protein